MGARGQATAERTRETALRLFARHGYAAVSMREIAAEVGVGAGALYNHFATKQDLLVELMVRHLEALIAAWDAEPLAAPGAPPDAAVEAFTRFHIRYHVHRADEVFVSYMEMRSLEPASYHRVERLRSAYEARLAAIIGRGVEAGVFVAPDIRVVTMALIGMITGVTTWYRPGGRLSTAEVEEIYVGMARRALGAGGKGRES